MTGEITLRGRVLGVGGIKEKAVAAHQGGIREVIIPASNSGELELLPDEVQDGIEFLLVRTMDEVLERALLPLPASDSAATAPESAEQAGELGMQISQ
jgi:ATP-dependent Lon protease